MINYNVLLYGAVADGKTDDRKAIQKAIDECEKTGGRVILPSGHTFYSSSLTIKKGVELHIEKGAVLKASGDIDTYIRPCNMINDPKTALIGNPVTNKPSFVFIYGYKADNCIISGDGEIDLNCGAFTKRVNDYYVTGDFYPRPTGIYIENSENIKVSDITITHAPFWTLHPAGCKNVEIESIKILNPLDTANSDGIDPDHCDNVTIRNSVIHCADDCICLKNSNGNSEYSECTNILVENCDLISTSAAIKIGTEGINNFKNIVFRNCKISKSNRGISIQIRDCGNVENVLFENITIETRRFHSSFWGTAEPIIITSFRRDKNTVSGKIKDVVFRNIKCESENGVLLYCDNDEISDIRFENVSVDVGVKSKWEKGLYDLRPCCDHEIEKGKNYALRIKGCENVSFSECNFNIETENCSEFSCDYSIENSKNIIGY